jgi:hypothetical protein
MLREHSMRPGGRPYQRDCETPNVPKIFTNSRKTTSEREQQKYQLTAVKLREKKLLKSVHKGHAADPVFGTYNITPFSTLDTLNTQNR